MSGEVFDCNGSDSIPFHRLWQYLQHVWTYSYPKKRSLLRVPENSLPRKTVAQKSSIPFRLTCSYSPLEPAVLPLREQPGFQIAPAASHYVILLVQLAFTFPSSHYDIQVFPSLFPKTRSACSHIFSYEWAVGKLEPLAEISPEYHCILRVTSFLPETHSGHYTETDRVHSFKPVAMFQKSVAAKPGSLFRNLLFSGTPLGISWGFLRPSPKKAFRDSGETLREPWKLFAATIKNLLQQSRKLLEEISENLLTRGCGDPLVSQKSLQTVKRKGDKKEKLRKFIAWGKKFVLRKIVWNFFLMSPLCEPPGEGEAHV